MEQPSSTKKSPERAAETGGAPVGFAAKPPELELPIDTGFKSEPPHLDPVAMYWRCEELMRQAARPLCREQRLEESIDAEFTM